MATANEMNAPSFLLSSTLVAIGGGVGAWLRFAIGRAIAGLLGPAASSFPWATLLINVTGSIAMGMLVGWLTRHLGDGEGWRLLLGVGVLGGFTTFSAFSLEIVMLAERGNPGLALIYAVTSCAVAIVGLFCGLAVMRAVG